MSCHFLISFLSFPSFLSFVCCFGCSFSHHTTTCNQTTPSRTNQIQIPPPPVPLSSFCSHSSFVSLFDFASFPSSLTYFPAFLLFLFVIFHCISSQLLCVSYHQISPPPLSSSRHATTPSTLHLSTLFMLFFTVLFVFSFSIFFFVLVFCFVFFWWWIAEVVMLLHMSDILYI